MAAVSTGNAQRYHWGDACDGWHRLAGRHGCEIDGVLGYSYGGEVVHRDDRITLIHPITSGQEINT